jgi:hypothetical protein
MVEHLGRSTIDIGVPPLGWNPENTIRQRRINKLGGWQERTPRIR